MGEAAQAWELLGHARAASVYPDLPAALSGLS
jgi:hypothetical protein